MRIASAFIATALLSSVLPVQAQQAYNLEFDVRSVNDTAGRTTRHFTMRIDDSRKGVFQAVDRVPVEHGSSSTIDVGATIECTAQESGGQINLRGTIELSSIDGNVMMCVITQPIIGQRKIAFDRTVKPGESVILVDDSKTSPAHKGNLVEATVTKLN
jgi:hypothetical protein